MYGVWYGMYGIVLMNGVHSIEEDIVNRLIIFI